MTSPIGPGVIPPVAIPTRPSVDEGASEATSERMGGATQAIPTPALDRVEIHRRVRTAELPSAPPPGTDPDIWALLTVDERAFFSSLESNIPVTYRPGQSSEAAARTGLRVDVRV